MSRPVLSPSSYLLLFMLLPFMLLPTTGHAQETTPWGPYKTISAIISNLNDICKYKNIHPIVDHVPIDLNKTPTDVYHQSYKLLKNVHHLAEQFDLEAENISPLPEEQHGRMIPEDVIAVLREVLVITESIHSKLNIPKIEVDISIEPSITPPYVYQKVMKANMLVDRLL